MSTNLITNFLNNGSKPAVPQNNKSKDIEIINVQRHKPHFDINRELENKTFIRPLPPKAKLVKMGILDAPAIFVKDAVYDVKAFRAGWKGDANDHQLGKLNDLGMKIGGLAIAAYLYTKRQQPISKAMEFIGLGSFFASMALWPKIALQLPAYLIHGFNVMPQYEDSYGRKKPLYQDNLFIPWDAAYSDKEIEKLGNRWGVPKDLPNRRDYVQEKMRMIALQNNTMWMLTAGFATPIMSALICNALTEPTSKLIDRISSSQADKLLLHFPDYAKRAQNKKVINAVDSLIELNKEKTVDKKMIESFAMALGRDRDMLTVNAIEKDLTNLLLDGRSSYTIPKEILPNIIDATYKALPSRFDKSVLDAIIPNEEELLKRFDESKALYEMINPAKGFTKDNLIVRKIFNQELSEGDLVKVLLDYEDMLRDKIKKYNASKPKKILREDVEIPLILRSLTKKTYEESPIYKVLRSTPSNKLDDSAQSVLKSLAKTMSEFNAKSRVLDKYAFKKFGTTSNLANYWNEVDKTILNALNFTDKDLALIKDDRLLVTPMLDKKLEDIAIDGEKYKKVVSDICEKIAMINKTIEDGAVSEEYKKLVDEVYERAANEFKVKEGKNIVADMPFLIKQLVGYDKLLQAQKDDRNADIRAFSQKDIQKSFAEGRLLSVKSSFERVLNTLDFYRRIETLDIPFKDWVWKGKMSQESAEEIIDAAKQILLDGHMADYETKFTIFRNPNPVKPRDKAEFKVENGKLVYEYLNKAKDAVRVEIPSDSSFFNSVMRLMYESKMHQDTVDVLQKYNIKEMPKYREAMLHEVGDVDYFAKKFHKLYTRFGEGSKASSERKFFLIGKSFTDLIFDAANRKYNTGKWLKIFGTAGAALLGVTVISQFFFGRQPKPKGIQKG